MVSLISACVLAWVGWIAGGLADFDKPFLCWRNLKPLLIGIVAYLAGVLVGTTF